MQGGDVFKLAGLRKAGVFLTFLWNGKREGALPLKYYEKGNFARFNVTILFSTFIIKVNGTGPLAGHYQLIDSEEPRCK